MSNSINKLSCAILTLMTAARNNYETDFTALYQASVQDIYRLCFVCTHYQPAIAQRLVYDVFVKAYTFFHTKNSNLYALACEEIRKEQQLTALPASQTKPAWLTVLTPAEHQVWTQLENLPLADRLCLELLYDSGLAPADVATILELPLSAVHNKQYLLKDVLHLQSLLDKRRAAVIVPQTFVRSCVRRITAGRTRAPSFVTRRWWEQLFGPVPVSFTLGSVLVVMGLWWYVYHPIQWQLAVPPATVTLPSSDSSATAVVTITARRPHDVTVTGTLPTVASTSQELTTTTELLYGTDYVTDRVVVDDDARLRPAMTVNLPDKDYTAPATAYIYATPEALTEDQLQFAALRHFITLPLNQFTYVNGTYYIADEADDFRPLFIAFNTDGTIEFQMRQAAICVLPGLTQQLSDKDAKNTAIDFLIAHNFIEVSPEDLVVERISVDDRTVAKDVFCKDGDVTPVQDREFVIYPPHTLLRYADGADHLLPLRFRGLAVQVHGDTVTNVRIDKLFLLQQYVVRTAQADVKSVADATTELKNFYYSASADRSEEQRFATVYPQWNHLHGDDRLRELTLTDVHLEYVFDELNHRLEPYYVFSGTGVDGNDRTKDIRLYVVASTEPLELRGPYRE